MTNTLFPGRPNYTGPTHGLFGLLHHDLLYELSHNVMERVAYVREYKPTHEVATRLHNMIYLAGCEAVIKHAALDADYSSKCDALNPLGVIYFAKSAPLYADILAYIKTHIPDCAWDGKELKFPDTNGDRA